MLRLSCENILTSGTAVTDVILRHRWFVARQQLSGHLDFEVICQSVGTRGMYIFCCSHTCM